MNQVIYDGVTYNSKKELKEATGLTGCKIKAKLRDKEITLIITDAKPYENNNKTTI